MFNGIFRITFTGHSGSGFGLLLLQNDIIVGADVTGTIFDGSYAIDTATQSIKFQLTMYFPAGVTPVQTGVPLVAPANVPLSGILSEQDLSGEKPVLLSTPIGPVNVSFMKIRDLP